MSVIAAGSQRTDTRPVGEHVRHRELVHAGSWVMASFFIFSAANYVFSLVLSHLLRVSDYGSFGVISSALLLQSLVATAGFPWMLSMKVARYTGAEHADTRASALSTALIGNAALGIVSGGVVGIVVHTLVPKQPLVPVLAGVAALLISTNSVWLGLYQGERRFPLQSLLRTVDSVTKAAAGIGLAALGFGLEGALCGIVSGALLITVWGALHVRGFKRPTRWIERAFLPTVAWTALAQLGLGLLMNMDILAVRALATGASASTGAGYYQAASVLGRAPVYVALAVLNAIFPFLVRSAGDRHAEARLIRTSLRVIALLPLPMAILLLAAPGPAIAFFFPPNYAPAVPLLRLNAAGGLALIVLASALLSLQATRGMRAAAVAVLPAVAMEMAALLFAVPRFGPEGAAWALVVAASAGAVCAWIPALRRWPLKLISPSPRLALALLMLGVAAAFMPHAGHLWIIDVVALGTAFLVCAWGLRGVSASELVPIVPQKAQPLVRRIVSIEEGAR